MQEEEKRSSLSLTLLLARPLGEEGASDGWHLCLPECAIRPLGRGNQGSLGFFLTGAVLNITQFLPDAESLPPFWFVSSLLRFGIGKTIAGKTRT